MKRNLAYTLTLIFFIVFQIDARSFPWKKNNPWLDDYSSISAMENYKSWGTYNVHDPSCLLIGDTYYMFSTDAIYFDRQNNQHKKSDIKPGFIQVRTSKDLVYWKFEGWAFSEIPTEAKEWVLSNNENKGATNIWAPYIVKYKDKFRLYYCVSAFGKQISYIGLAESSSPLGPWEQKGCVVKTKIGDKMNSIDPSIVTNPSTDEMWMHYGSYFGGLYVVQFNPKTGYTMTQNDQGKSIARRANAKKDNIEAPEIIYNPAFKKYYLFTSYDPLMTTYNIRVGKSDSPDGPFLDFYGKDLRDTINHLPILTYPYRFENHSGWAGTGHCSVFQNEKNEFFLAHQARLSPENHLMVLHIRELKWTKNGWPVVSPERFSNSKKAKISKSLMIGEWEMVRINETTSDRNLEYGQILWGENKLRKMEMNVSNKITFSKNDEIQGAFSGTWKFTKNDLTLNIDNETIENLIVFIGHDWENNQETIIFTGLDKNGRSVWGKKVN